jgi:hypothetical protein
LVPGRLRVAAAGSDSCHGWVCGQCRICHGLGVGSGGLALAPPGVTIRPVDARSATTASAHFFLLEINMRTPRGPPLDIDESR